MSPIEFEEDYLTRKIDIGFDGESLPMMSLKLKPLSKWRQNTYKTLAVVAGLWGFFLLVTETTLVFSSKDAVSRLLWLMADNTILVFLVTFILLVLLIGTAVFTIFKLKFSDYLQLVPGHTDAVTMATFVGFFSTLISVSCFNLMLMAG